MISQVYSLFSFKEFGEIDNPVWHVEWPVRICQLSSLQFNTLTSVSGHVLIPGETLDEFSIHTLKQLPPLAKQKIVIQLGLHQIEQVNPFSEIGFAVQLWVDRDVDISLVPALSSLVEKIDILFVPFDRFDIEKSLSHFRKIGFKNFTFLVLQRKNAYSGILNIHSQFQLYQRLQLLLPETHLKSAVSLSSIQKSSHGLGSFLLSPTYEHYLKHLKEQNLNRYWFQNLAGFLNRMGLGFIVALLILIIETVKEPFVMHGRVSGYLKRVMSYTHKLRAYPPRIQGLGLRVVGVGKWLWSYTHKFRAYPPRIQGLGLRIAGFFLWLWSYTHKLKGIPPKIHGLYMRVYGFVLRFRVLGIRARGFARRVRGWLDHLNGPCLWLKGFIIAVFWKVHDWLFPLFKIYYIVKFQFEKRILRKGKN